MLDVAVKQNQAINVCQNRCGTNEEKAHRRVKRIRVRVEIEALTTTSCQ